MNVRNSALLIFIWFLTVFGARMEHTKLTQRAEVRVLRIQGKSIAEIHRELVQMQGGNALSISTVRRWYHKFDAGDHDITMRRTGGRVSKVTPEILDKVRGLLEEDNTMCLRVISRRTGLSLRTVHDILQNKLKLKKRPAKWIPHLLNLRNEGQNIRDFCSKFSLCFHPKSLHRKELNFMCMR